MILAAINTCAAISPIRRIPVPPWAIQQHPWDKGASSLCNPARRPTASKSVPQQKLMTSLHARKSDLLMQVGRRRRCLKDSRNVRIEAGKSVDELRPLPIERPLTGVELGRREQLFRMDENRIDGGMERGIISPVFCDRRHSSAPPRRIESKMPIVLDKVMSL